MRHTSPISFLGLLAALCIGGTAGAQTPAKTPKPAPKRAPEDVYRDEVVPLVKKFCLDCHGPEKQESDVAFHRYKTIELVAQDEKTWKTVAPQRPFLYHFLDQSFGQQYDSDQRFGYLFSLFSCLAIFVACLGLFGLATFTAQQRIKEIGIRKVLGASVAHITGMLSVDFLKLVIVAIFIASPIAWLMMSKYLQNFAYRIDIKWWVFAITAFTVTVTVVLPVALFAALVALMVYVVVIVGVAVTDDPMLLLNVAEGDQV